MIEEKNLINLTNLYTV